MVTQYVLSEKTEGWQLVHR